MSFYSAPQIIMSGCIVLRISSRFIWRAMPYAWVASREPARHPGLVALYPNPLNVDRFILVLTSRDERVLESMTRLLAAGEPAVCDADLRGLRCFAGPRGGDSASCRRFRLGMAIGGRRFTLGDPSSPPSFLAMGVLGLRGLPPTCRRRWFSCGWNPLALPGTTRRPHLGRRHLLLLSQRLAGLYADSARDPARGSAKDLHQVSGFTDQRDDRFPEGPPRCEPP